MNKKYRLIYIPTGEFNDEKFRVDERFLDSSKYNQLAVLCVKACNNVATICLDRPCSKCCWLLQNISNNENLYEIVELEE